MRELRHSASLGPRTATSSPMKRDEDAAPLFPDGDDRDADDHHRSRAPPLNSSRIWLILLCVLLLAGLISLYSIFTRLNAPYLCKKDGITLHCPRVSEPPSLWKNPDAATTSWKPCAERRGISDVPGENETNGYIFIHAEGGLNQQRIAV